MKSKQILLTATAILIFTTFVFAILLLRPIPKASVENCGAVTGHVEKIMEGSGENDIVIFLKNNNNYYYVNRGLERGLDLETLQSQLTDQLITLRYVKHWSPLDPKNQSRHIARMDFNGNFVYNEIP